MADFTTAARPYAKAVFELAQETGQFDAWSGKLAFLAAVASNPEMSQRLDAPNITQADRASMMEKVVGDELDEHGRNFIRLLAENNRLALLPDIEGIYQALRAEAEGEIEATVTSAFELTDEQRNKIADALSRRLDRKVRIVSQIDDSLIGGAIIQAGDLVIDGSLKGRVDKLTQALAS